MRAPGPMFEVEGGVRRALAPVIREIPEMAEAFPDFKARLREYVLEGEIGDGSVDWEIESGSVYALRIEPLDGGGPVRRFDFGTESSPVADGNLQVAAPRHRVQAWYVHPDLTAAGGKTYRVRMELQSEEPGRSIGIGIRPHAWSSPFSTKWQTLNLGEGWGTHAVLYTAPEGLSGRLRVIFNPDGSPGTVRLGKVDWEDARP